ncbi:MAG: flagellar hook capping FlgD N-terminal domain-containing protein, partial [Lentilitoribacter sp.]
MEIVNTQAAQVTSQVTSAQTETSNALASDFETFLKMLTAQARYQDPLEPIDSSEYAAQLAQFSMVEQQ